MANDLRRAGTALVLALSLAACGGDGGGTTPDGGGDAKPPPKPIGHNTLILDAGELRLYLLLDAKKRPLLSVRRADGKTEILRSAPYDQDGFGAIGWNAGKPTVKMYLGFFGFKDALRKRWGAPLSAGALERQGDTVRAGLTDIEGAAGLTAQRLGRGAMRIKITAPVTRNRTQLSWLCGKNEQFLGLGAQTRAAHRGRVVPMWTQEQGIGKRDGQDHLGAYSPVGDTYDSYFPVPVFYSTSGYMVLVEGNHRKLIDLCSTHKDRWRALDWTTSVSIVIAVGKTPLQMMERITALTGRPKMPAPWVFAPWLDTIKGQANLLAAARKLRKEKVPASVIWTEDWAGGKAALGGYHLSYRWSVDTKLYPDLKKATGELHRLGFRFLGYFNPFIRKTNPEWAELAPKGRLVKDAQGKTLSFTAPPFLDQAGLLDFTNKDTVTWVKAKMKAALALGIDGWMADFGEWLPWEAKLSNGVTGEVAHNDYPRQWQRVNRDFFATERPKGDFTYFVRSGFTGSQQLAPVVWAGDQNTDFGQDDGLPTVIPIGVNLGFAGVAFYGHDIGGYSSIGGVKPTDKELFFRWTEVGAFSPVMRTHHGTSGGKGWAWDRDAATIAHFKKYAAEHVALFPYLFGLARDASSRGHPIMRALVVHHSDAPANVADQYLLGPALMVSPIVKRGLTSRKVVVPGGVWFDYWDSTKRYQGPDTVTIKAALGEIPVMVRAGSIIPRLPPGVQTLASGGTGVTDLLSVSGKLEADVYLGADGTFTLADGSRFNLTARRNPPGPGMTLKLEGAAMALCGGTPAAPCYRRDDAKRRLEIYLATKTFKIEASTRAGLRTFDLDAVLARKTSLTLRVRY